MFSIFVCEPSAKTVNVSELLGSKYSCFMLKYWQMLLWSHLLFDLHQTSWFPPGAVVHSSPGEIQCTCASGTRMLPSGSRLISLTNLKQSLWALCLCRAKHQLHSRLHRAPAGWPGSSPAPSPITLHAWDSSHTQLLRSKAHTLLRPLLPPSPSSPASSALLARARSGSTCSWRPGLTPRPG